ncbi:hypothetical protein ICHIJ1_03380 [Fluviibacter phosphoraccumulans]|uniref:Uncharacterized protein n=1 Tax=Fluviibacter phosphoraccumulans TaxID=1751046 RepID=A0A7R6R0E7_9RHOO|nr:hypothetical protein ICHIAU1_03240 [Fluviibacter phosphoraccumulans]BBU70419.1 hypothetical protein ICHIJ1_03380 [Fluviibacter phosphoraccumulans]
MRLTNPFATIVAVRHCYQNRWCCSAHPSGFPMWDMTKGRLNKTYSCANGYYMRGKQLPRSLYGDHLRARCI